MVVKWFPNPDLHRVQKRGWWKRGYRSATVLGGRKEGPNQRKKQLEGATAVCVYDIICVSATVVCVVCMPFVFRPTSLRGGGSCCERPDGVGKAPLLDAAAQNVVDSSTRGGCRGWWRVRSLVLRREEAQALREHGDGLQFLWRASVWWSRGPKFCVEFVVRN